MDKSYCKKIDDELLVEKYVEGKMSSQEREKFENHIKECPIHAQAVILEKALHRGITEFARSEIRSHLKRSVQKREDIRFYVLRYAAILFLVVITPLILYYQFYMPQSDQNQYNKRSPLIESQTPDGEKSEHQQIEQKSRLVEKPAATMPPASEKNKVRKEDVLTTTKMEREKSEISRTTGIEKKPAEEPPAFQKTREYLETESEKEKLSQQSIQRIRSEKKLSALGVSAKSAEILDAKIHSKTDSEKFSLLENQMKICIVTNRETLKIKPYFLAYSFIIDTTGHTSHIQFLEMSESDPGIDSCLKAIIRKWQFDKSNEEVTVTRKLTIPIE